MRERGTKAGPGDRRGTYRKSYAKAATLIAACAEVFQLRGREEEARKLIEALRAEFPRHRAFQSELDHAIERIGPRR